MYENMKYRLFSSLTIPITKDFQRVFYFIQKVLATFPNINLSETDSVCSGAWCWLKLVVIIAARELVSKILDWNKIGNFIELCENTIMLISKVPYWESNYLLSRVISKKMKWNKMGTCRKPIWLPCSETFNSEVCSPKKKKITSNEALKTSLDNALGNAWWNPFQTKD